MTMKKPFISLVFLFLALCLYLYGIDSVPQVPRFGQHTISKSCWVDAALETEIDDPFDIGPLKELCSRTKWRSGLVFDCPRPAGGIGNVRNKVLTCIRYAIEAGADFIIPGIMARSKHDLSALVTQDIMDFEYMFSRDFFLKSLSEACPQMLIYRDLADFMQRAWVKNYIRLDVGNLVQGSPRRNWVEHPEDWGLAFTAWLKEHDLNPSPDAPVVVNIGHPLFQWPMSYETLSLRKALGRTLRFNDGVRKLAASTLYSLSQFISNSSTSTEANFNPGIEPRKGITNGTFFGAHLRTDKDAREAGWPGYEIQSKIYLSQAVSSSLSTIYVSCGSMSDIQRFKNESWMDHGIRVVSKDMLLTDDELSNLRNLTWDQQGLVDYEVLLKSSIFGGMDGSSFALNIGIRRHVLSNETYAAGPNFLSSEEGMTISDEFSQVFGGPGNNAAIYLGMWP